MQYKAVSAEDYIQQLPKERQAPMQKLRNVLLKNLPKGFEEVITYGMISYVVPHTVFPAGYHCDPKQPLPFISIASQKNFIALYHMGLYADQELLTWFQQAYPEHSKTKLDMGKSCIRFKKPDQIPFELIGELAGKMGVDRWVDFYESTLNKSSK